MIEFKRHDDILEIVLKNPPVNALAADVRQGLANAIQGAQSDDGIHAVVLRGDGKLFSGGADITEFGKAPADPMLPALIDLIEASNKPVVAAIHGSALGGGLEIALGCHYRIASPSAKLGLPEVKLGLLPGAGGTQRLPRLVGVSAALDMIVFGDPISAKEGLRLGLIDELTEADDQLAARAIAYARTRRPRRRTSEMPLSAEPQIFDMFASKNARKIKNLDAPTACIEAIRAATEMPFDRGREIESELFVRLMNGDQSKALRHVFFAERMAAKIEGMPSGTRPRPVAKVGVVGAGTMGGGISMNFLSAGIPVTIIETQQDALDRGTGVIRQHYEASAAKGRLTSNEVEAAMGLLTPKLGLEALGDCDLIIEAIYENMDAKKDLFARLDAVAKPSAILASNTSFLSIDELASTTTRPQDVLGLHFFSPANVMKLLEVVRGAATGMDVLATGMELARRIGKVPVVSAVCHGFIGNRMLAPRQENAEALLLEGATPEQIDRVHTAFGMPMGPFEMADLAGMDIGWHRDYERIESLRDALCAADRWGQKNRAGYYDYDDKRKAAPSPVVEQIIADFRRKSGITVREISEEEIMVRTFYTMVNEGAKILDEGVAQRASDIDVVWIYGYGWPRHKGGPMFWAEQLGLETIAAGLQRYADRMPSGFSLAPLLVKRAADGDQLEPKMPIARSTAEAPRD